jgi:UDP-glucuronate decarboxylase
MLQNKDVTVYGSGNQTRSFCYVDDTVECLIRMMQSATTFTGPVNVGNPQEHTINEIADILAAKIPTKSKIVYRELPADDPTKRKPDISKAQAVLGWNPQISLDEGLDRTITYFKHDLLR